MTLRKPFDLRSGDLSFPRDNDAYREIVRRRKHEKRREKFTCSKNCETQTSSENKQRNFDALIGIVRKRVGSSLDRFAVPLDDLRSTIDS